MDKEPVVEEPAVAVETPPAEPVVEKPPEDETMVPVKVVQELREKLKASEGNNETLVQNNTALNQHIQNNQPPQSPSVQQDDGIGGLFKDRDDEDIPTYGELKRITNAMVANTNGLFSQFSTRIQYQDYESVVETHLPNVLKDKPHLTEAIRTSSNPTALAYELAKTDPGYKQDVPVATNADAQKILAENSIKPMSINQTAGGVTPVKENDMTMSKAKHEEKLAKILSEAR